MALIFGLNVNIIQQGSLKSPYPWSQKTYLLLIIVILYTMLVFIVGLIDFTCKDFFKKYYMYQQCEVPTSLDVRIRCIIFYVKDVLSNGILLPKGKNRQECWKYLNNYIFCHHHIDNFIHHKLKVVLDNLLCFIHIEKKKLATIIL